MIKEQIKEKAKDFVSKIAGGMSKEMDYYADILAEFATEVTKELEKENAEQKERISTLEQIKKEHTDYTIKVEEERTCAKEQLTKAKELLNEFMRISKASDEDFEHDYSELIGEAEQFLKDLEK